MFAVRLKCGKRRSLKWNKRVAIGATLYAYICLCMHTHFWEKEWRSLVWKKKMKQKRKKKISKNKLQVRTFWGGFSKLWIKSTMMKNNKLKATKWKKKHKIVGMVIYTCENCVCDQAHDDALSFTVSFTCVYFFDFDIVTDKIHWMKML